MDVLSIIEKAHNWSTFKRSLEGLSSQDKGDSFEMLVKLYLAHDPIYTAELKNVWLLKEVPSKIREYINLPLRDMGIDIIAETHEGKFWAVQCKYRSNNEGTLNWKQDISTFAGLAFSVCRNISFGLICTTGEKYSRLLEKQDNISVCTSEIWQALDSQFFDMIHTSLSGRASASKELKPRPHQERAVTKAKAYFNNPVNSRGKLIMPCGTGKSLTAHWIAKALDAKTILVVVPSLLLLRHTLNTWATGYSDKDFKWICVCSDEGVRDISTDETILHPQDMGVPCATEVDEIVSWFEDTDKASVRVVFTTYQSGKATASASRKAGIVYDLAVFDEAHKTVGHVDKSFSHLLFDKNISVQKRLFMTATERRYLGKSSQMVSMDDSAIYGEAFEVLTFKEALKQVPSILSDYKILTLYITRSEINELVQKNKFVMPTRGNWNSEVESAMLASLAAIKKAMQKYPIKHTVSFHTTVARAKVFKENSDIFTATFPEYGQLDAFHISGSDPVSVRERVLSDFVDSPRSLITNARCLTEGVDVPTIDSVVFADPKQSKVDIVQAVGRALRPTPDKKFGYIIIPVIVDMDEDLSEVWKTDSFEALLTTLRALASNDERIIDYFRGIETGRQTERIISHSFTDDVKIIENIDVESFISSVDIQCWDGLAKLSHWPFFKSRSFIRRLHLEDKTAWNFYSNNSLMGLDPKPEGIPKNPEKVYKSDWQGWSDWLGPSPKRRYAEYDAARDFVQTMGFTSKKSWDLYASNKGRSRVGVIPPNPEAIYRREWRGWSDWLGATLDTPKKKRKGKSTSAQYLPFDQARKLVHKLGVSSRDQFRVLPKEALRGVPKDPQKVYSDQWKDWDHWLAPEGRLLSFKEARTFVHLLNLKNQGAWEAYSSTRHKLKSISDNPKRVYNDEWQGWDDWLHEGEQPLPFNLARVFARKLKLKTEGEWKVYSASQLSGYEDRPSYIPPRPKQVYSDEWLGWDDWLGL